MVVPDVFGVGPRARRIRERKRTRKVAPLEMQPRRQRRHRHLAHGRRGIHDARVVECDGGLVETPADEGAPRLGEAGPLRDRIVGWCGVHRREGDVLEMLVDVVQRTVHEGEQGTNGMKAQEVATVVRLDELPGQRAPLPGLVALGGEERQRRHVERERRVGDVGARWERQRQATDRLCISPIDERERPRHDQPHRGTDVGDGDQMRVRRGQIATLDADRGDAPDELLVPRWLARAELTFEHRPDEPVVPHDAGLLVVDAQEDAESEQLPDDGDRLISEQEPAQLEVERGRDGQRVRHVSVVFGKDVHDLSDDVVAHAPVQPGEHVGRFGRGEQAEVQPERPSLDRSVEHRDLGVIERGAHRAGEIAGVGIAEGQVGLPHVGDPSSRPPTRERERRLAASAHDQPHAVTDAFHEERQPVQDRPVFDAREVVEDHVGVHVRPLDPADERAERVSVRRRIREQRDEFGVDAGQHRIEVREEVPPERVSTCIDLAHAYERGRGRGVVSSVEPLPEGGRLSIAGRRDHRRDPGRGVEAAVDLAAENRGFVDGASGLETRVHVGRAHAAPSVAPTCAVTATPGIRDPSGCRAGTTR